jgi:integrase
VQKKCMKTQGSIDFCPNGDKHVFKVVVYIPGTKRTRTRILETKNVDEAIVEAIEFEKYLKENNYEIESHKERILKPHLLIDCMSLYIDYLNNIDIPAYRQKVRSTGHINEVERYFRYFIECLKQQKIDYSSIRIQEINDKILGLFYTYIIKEKNYNNVSYNKVITIMKGFFNFLIEGSGYDIRNPFKQMKRLSVRPIVETITEEEYSELLSKIDSGSSMQILSTGEKKYHYYSWLKFGIQLGLMTGRRRDEIINLKYCDIKYDKGGNLLYIESEDYKVNRARTNISESSKKLIYIPITRKLKELLVENGLKQNKENDTFLLAPEKTENRETLKNQMSKGFSHYYNQLKTGRNLTFKCLRKTYITHLALSLGLNARVITRHSGDDVLIKHYLDRKLLLKMAENFDVF